MDNKLITIDLNAIDKNKPIDLIIAKDGSLAKEAENEIIKILQTKDLIDTMVDYIKERMSEEMEKRQLIKVKAGKITISKRYFGNRYQLNGASEEFINKVEYDKPNTETIDNYVKENGKLPEGIILRDREEKVSILKREEDL